jgi:hypothetical protein
MPLLFQTQDFIDYAWWERRRMPAMLPLLSLLVNSDYQMIPVFMLFTNIKKENKPVI